MIRHDPKVFELTIPSRLEEVENVHTFVKKAARESGLDEETAHWIDLSVSESAINAIQHGNGSNPEKEVFLRITADGEAIEVIVDDQGEGFELEEIADPTDVENILKPAGRGILIIRSFMDEVALVRRKGGGCRLRMVKRIKEGDPG